MDLSFSSRRSPILSRTGMVAASQPLAVAAGIEILRAGGNAADAAIACAAALNVTEPMSTGLGGDAFSLYYEASTHKVHALNGSGRSPAALTLKLLAEHGVEQNLPDRHPFTVTVPGACAAWCDLVDRFGRLSLSKDLSPAIRLAEEGFPVAPLTAAYWQAETSLLLSTSPGGRELTINGRAPSVGEVFRNPGLAASLKLVGEQGKQGFYRGEMARKIAETVHSAGGCLTPDDLAEHTSEWVEPISIQYHDKQIWQCPPNGQGLTVLLALNILEGLDLKKTDPLSPQRLHLLVESLRLAFSDSFYYVSDPTFQPAPLAALLGKDYAAERRKLINPNRRNPSIRHGVPLGQSDTVYLSVVDAEGNACSFINSTYMHFGSGIVPTGCGFSLQNRGRNFSLAAGHPNVLGPRKRTYHTIIPGMVTRIDDQSLYACYGVMGAFMQPQGHVQVLVGLLEDDLDPQAALDRPRFCIDPHEDEQLSLEEGLPPETFQTLADIGHRTQWVQGLQRNLFGRGQIILRNPSDGVLQAGSDPRADGCAMCP